MYLINNCMACRSYNVEFHPIYLDRFVVQRATGIPTVNHRPCYAIVCNECSWVGTDARMNDEEMARYYNDYRGQEYNDLRIKYDPRYREIAEHFETQAEVDRRLVGLNYILEQSVELESIKTLLDFGGNDGKFIPKFEHHVDKYVYDISSKSVEPGVKKLDLNSNMIFDFVMCCHVVEHESDPDRVIEQVLKFGDNETLFYFEVPNYDCPSVPGGVFHEHLSIFNPKSISTFLLRHRLMIVDSVKYSDYIGFLTRKQ